VQRPDLRQRRWRIAEEFFELGYLGQIYLRRRFSSCSSLSWDIMDVSMPPYLLRHL